MSAPKHRAPRSRARLAAVALPLIGAALVAPTMSANAAAPTSLYVYDGPGWLSDYINLPTPATCNGTLTVTVGSNAPVSPSSGGKNVVFATYPGADKTLVVVKCDATTYPTYTFETKQTYQAVATTAEPVITDKPGTGSDAVTLSNLPGVTWTVATTPASAVDGDYYATWFEGAKTKNLVLPANTTAVTVTATEVTGFTLFKSGAFTPVATAWSRAVTTGPATVIVPAASEPKFIDADGTSGDAVTVTPVANVSWTATGGATTVPIDLSGAKSAVTKKLSDLFPAEAKNQATMGVKITATSSDPASYTVKNASGAVAEYLKSFQYQPKTINAVDTVVAAVDNPGTAADAVAITSPAGVKWKIDGVEVKVTAGRETKTPVKTASVVVTAEAASTDYLLSGSFGGTITFTNPNITVPDPSASITHVSSNSTVTLTGVDNVSYTVNGTAVTVATGTSKTFTIPGTGQIVIIAKPKAGFSLAGAAGDGSKTFAG